MIAIEDVDLSPELREALKLFATQVREFRAEGPLDEVAVAKLEEHFKASHVYHSAGIEGNRLTLQETVLVLKEGLEISGKPLRDVVEVRNLGAAYDYLRAISGTPDRITEAHIRSLHEMLIGDDPKLCPGEYRKIGVVISGSEHKPPEPLQVPAMMEVLVNWINDNIQSDAVTLAALAHHELAAIHPFVDGNGRVSRLLMNLLLLRHHFPICNISRTDRPAYYEALSYADVGLYEPLVQLVLTRSSELFSEYVRIRTETRRMTEWAERWGKRATTVLIRRESREMELWLTRVRQVFLEFEKAAELLDDKFGGAIKLSFYDYKNDITFEKYQQLMEEGKVSQANAFSVTFHDDKNARHPRFMFRYYRNFEKFAPQKRVIPLELNYYDTDQKAYVRLSDLPWAQVVRLREIYFTAEGEFTVRWYNRDKVREVEDKACTIAESVQWFYDDVLRNVIGLSDW